MPPTNQNLESTRTREMLRAQYPPSLLGCVQYHFGHDNAGCAYLDDLASANVLGTQDRYLLNLQLRWISHLRQYSEASFPGLTRPDSGLCICQAPVCHVGNCRNRFRPHVQLSSNLTEIVSASRLDCSAVNFTEYDEQTFLWR